jgi:type II secretory pathway component PulJ
MKRSGKSLIEMMIVMSLLSSILLLCGQMLMGMFRADTAQSAVAERTAAHLRLADRFRADVHSASEARLEPVGEGVTRKEQLVLSLPEGRTATYAAGTTLTRTVKKGDQRVSFDAWPLASDAVQWELANGSKKVILLLLTPLPKASQPATATGTAASDETAARSTESVRIEATVGFDGRDAGEGKP